MWIWRTNIEAFLLIALLINLGLSFWVASLAGARGRNKAGWFLLAFLFSVLVALLGLLVVGDSDSKRAERLMEDKAAQDLLGQGFDGTPEALAEYAKKKAGTYQSKNREPSQEETNPWSVLLALMFPVAMLVVFFIISR